MNNFNPIIWKNETLLLLDQRLLPHQEVFIECTTLESTIWSIKEMVVRGAPCIGFSAIFGLAIWVKAQNNFLLGEFRNACDLMISARPTAVNLYFEVERCFNLISKLELKESSVNQVYKKLVEFGLLQLHESGQKNLKMAQIGFEKLNEKFGERKLKLMTHCNTGFLACGSLGTALGVISYTHQKGMVDYVLADETRPYLQGSRLTAYELSKENIPYHIVVEGAASYLMSHGKVDAIFVGADRIAANGDTANKIGTSTLAIIAHHYHIPFYVVAPVSSFDTSIQSGVEIEIEMRPSREITHYKEHLIAPVGASVINPSFDVTDHRHITGIICEKGFIDPSIPGDLLRVLGL